VYKEKKEEKKWYSGALPLFHNDHKGINYENKDAKTR